MSNEVSIGQDNVSYAELGRETKFVILLNQAILHETRQDGDHFFQSCTFNRSVTSPARQIKHLPLPPYSTSSQCHQNVTTGVQRECFASCFGKLSHQKQTGKVESETFHNALSGVVHGVRSAQNRKSF
jgi:hypothetical protein